MREVRRSALLPYTPAQMYALVADVERYPEFLPWCSSARILASDGDEMTVTLGLSKGLARGSFTTLNRLVADRAVTMQLVDGPFESLEGRWDFTPVGDAGARADLHVTFETRGVLGGIALGQVFEAACNRLVEAFARRAREVYGAR
jgi:ribosome-associated toxin RatA of RatAB toxin-antitoxin module